MLDTMELQAGRELDALIAERVMGLNVVARDWPCGCLPDSCGYEASPWPGSDTRAATWYKDQGPVYLPDGGTWPPIDLEDGDNPGLIADVEPVPFYSTDIAAAWQVIEHLRDLWSAATDNVPGWDNSFTAPFNDGAFFDYLHRHADRRWPWALLYLTPEAICRAALRAVAVHTTPE